jgi:hypothetical protein
MSPEETSSEQVAPENCHIPQNIYETQETKAESNLTQWIRPIGTSCRLEMKKFIQSANVRKRFILSVNRFQTLFPVFELSGGWWFNLPQFFDQSPEQGGPPIPTGVGFKPPN